MEQKSAGGSINSMASVVVRRMFYVTSGYSGNAMPGNALLGSSVDRPVASREGPSSQDLEIPRAPTGSSDAAY